MSALSVQNAVSYANANAAGFVGLANSALATANGAVASVDFSGVTWVPPTVPGTPSLSTMPSAPTIVAPTLTVPADPGAAPTLQLATLADPGAAPTLAVPLPTLSFPDKPNALVSNLGSMPDINTSFTFPDAPASLSTTLTVPTFTARTEPTAPQTLIPSFITQTITPVADAPTNGQALMDSAYSTETVVMQKNADAYVTAMMQQYNPNYATAMAAIETQLSAYLAGGTALKPAIENAIYERARSKNNADALRVRDTALNDAATRGFMLPSGALLSALQQARQGGADNNAKASTDIAIAQAEMEQKNLQFAVTTSANLRTSMVSAAMAYMGHVISINGQAMDYAKSVFTNLVEMYNASVRVYSARVEAYRGYTAIYEVQLKAAMASLDVYRAQIAALEAMTQVDRAKVEIYTAQIQGTMSMIALYRAQIEAVQGKVALEKTKLEIFQAQVQSYGAQVQAKNGEWSGYNAAMAGEEAKVRIYSAEVGAYNSQISAYTAKIGALVAQTDNITKVNSANAAMYGATVQAYTEKVRAASMLSTAQNENNRAIVVAYSAQMTGYETGARVQLAAYSAQAQASLANATGGLSAQVESARAKAQHGLALAQIAEGGAQIYGTLAAAAMSGLNTLAADISNS